MFRAKYFGCIHTRHELVNMDGNIEHRRWITDRAHTFPLSSTKQYGFSPETARAARRRCSAVAVHSKCWPFTKVALTRIRLGIDEFRAGSDEGLISKGFGADSSIFMSLTLTGSPCFIPPGSYTGVDGRAGRMPRGPKEPEDSSILLRRWNG